MGPWGYPGLCQGFLRGQWGCSQGALEGCRGGFGGAYGAQGVIGGQAGCFKGQLLVGRILQGSVIILLYCQEAIISRYGFARV